MSYSRPFPAPGFAAGDIVRCRLANPGEGIHFGHIYTVRAVEAADDFDAVAEGRGPLLHLAGITRPQHAARFSLVSRAGNDNVPAGDGTGEASRIPQLMAATMREAYAATGACDIHDLARAGFTAAQITEYVDDARGLAGPCEPADGTAGADAGSAA